MPKGYLIGRAVVTDPDKWAKYAAKATDVLKQYGGRSLARGGRFEVGEGEGRPRNIIHEFDSYEQARAYLFSAEYAAARKLREGAGHIDLIVVEGV